MIPVTYCLPWNRPDPLDRRAVLRTIADSGMKRLVLSSNVLDELICKPEMIPIYTRELADFNLTLMDAHAPWGTWKDPGMPQEEGHELIVLRHKMAIRLCHTFGVTSMAFHTGNTFRSIFGDYTLDDYYAMLIRSLEELLPDAEKYGVVLALENQWTPLNQSAYLLKAVKHFNSPYLGLCYDSGHAFLIQNCKNVPEMNSVSAIWDDLGIPVVCEKDLISQFQPYLINCHLHDNNGLTDQHQPPGTGSIPDWPHIMEMITTAPRLQCVQNESAGTDFSELRRLCGALSPLLDA